MRTIRLVTVSDEFDNKPGFALATAKHWADGFMADREGVLIAHDVLEHVNGPAQIGSVWDELEALGAIWQVRARHGDLFTGRNYGVRSMAENIAADLTRMFAEFAADPFHGPGSAKAGTRPHDYDSEFMECITIARNEIPREFDSPNDITRQLEPYLALALRRMRIGFRKAEKRYGTGFQASNQFVAIREAIADAQKQIDFEGQEFRLRYGHGEAIVTPIYSY